MTNTSKRNVSFKAFLRVSIASIIIGTIILFIMSNFRINSLQTLAVNAGYSLMIGVGLFSNSYIYNYMESRWLSWTKHPFRTSIIVITVTLIYSSVVILFVNWFWFHIILKVSWGNFKEFGYNIIISEYIALSMVTLFMYAKSFFNDWRKAIISEEKLKQQAIDLQYKVLSNQVNPHFLFNSLNILNSLIAINQDKAQAFVLKLSDFYRKLLDFRNVEIISIERELEFVQLYIALQTERFGNNFHVSIHLENKNFYVIPMTLQLLIENAIKHNQISSSQHLNINIKTQNNYLEVNNTYAPYSTPVDGNGLGLYNLKERYQYFSENPIIVEQTEELFTVKIPILNIEN